MQKRTADVRPEIKRVWTVGHSTLEWPAFLSLLSSNNIRALADVRTFPGSRRYPHFNQERMQPALRDAGIAYVWMPDLGGRRKPRSDSRNTAWRNAAFRGYADHMESAAFLAALDRLQALAAERAAAYMCSEAVWWRCHRGLISDALKVRGWEVLHIAAGGVKPHPYTPAARVSGDRLSYNEPTLL